MRYIARKSSIAALLAASLLLATIVACGGAAPTEAPSTDQSGSTAPQQPAAQQAAPAQPAATEPAVQSAPALSAPAQEGSGQTSGQVASEQAVPTAVPQAASATGNTATAAEPEGTLNTGLKETGPFFLHPSTLGNPQIFVHGTAPIGEGLLQKDINREVSGLLAKSWEISEDFLTWTFVLNEGVQFHKGYGRNDCGRRGLVHAPMGIEQASAGRSASRFLGRKGRFRNHRRLYLQGTYR